MSLSQAKGCPEKELWDMGLGDYYSTLAAFGKYVEYQNELMKKKNN